MYEYEYSPSARCRVRVQCVRLCVVQEIMRDKWVNVGYEETQIEPYEEPTLQLEDETRIAELVQLGFKRDDIHESLVGRKFDTIYATYMLLGRKVCSRTCTLRISSLSHTHTHTLSLSLSRMRTHCAFATLRALLSTVAVAYGIHKLNLFSHSS